MHSFSLLLGQFQKMAMIKFEALAVRVFETRPRYSQLWTLGNCEMMQGNEVTSHFGTEWRES